MVLSVLGGFFDVKKRGFWKALIFRREKSRKMLRNLVDVVKIRVSSAMTTCLICMVFVVENERRQIFVLLGCPMALNCDRGRRFGRTGCARDDSCWGPWGARRR